MHQRKWKDVFERLPIERKDKSLTEISGFTNFCKDPKRFRENVVTSLNKELMVLGKSDASVCEVGCGCGDKLSFFYQQGFSCYGIDFSKTMIERGKIEIPKADLYIGEACNLPFENNSMDFVFSYSVFFYFENAAYCCQVLEEMYRIAKPQGIICVWDLPDIMERGSIIALRGEHEKGYEHTYYDMNEFIQWFKNKDIDSVKSEYLIMPEYKLSQSRFNITARLNKKSIKEA